MSMAYIRDHYDVPAKRGARIRFQPYRDAYDGVIVGSCGQYLRVRFDGEPLTIQTLHPTWGVTYL